MNISVPHMEVIVAQRALTFKRLIHLCFIFKKNITEQIESFFIIRKISFRGEQLLTFSSKNVCSGCETMEMITAVELIAAATSITSEEIVLSARVSSPGCACSKALDERPVSMHQSIGQAVPDAPDPDDKSRDEWHVVLDPSINVYQLDFSCPDGNSRDERDVGSAVRTIGGAHD